MSKLSLSQVLSLDALSCAAIFGLGVGATGLVSGLLGLPASVVVIGGWICLSSAVLFAFLAVRPVRPLLLAGVAGNAAWVAASIAVWFAFFAALTPLGHAVVLAQAAIVAIFVVLEAKDMRALPSGRAVAA